MAPVAPVVKESTDEAVLAQLRSAAAEDLRFLAFLHSREIDGPIFEELRLMPFAERLCLSLQSPLASSAMGLIDKGLKEEREDSGIDLIDALAVDYADIYVTHQLRAAPAESVWLDKDKLILQEPMFEIRDWYERYGLKAANWRTRSDDHLVLQLEFIAFLLEREDIAPDQPARFMDDHILRWIDLFSQQVSGYCSSSFYGGLALLTSVYLDELREHLVVLAGCERRVREPDDVSDDTGHAGREEQPYIPGIGPVV